jgi:hypothetical protein
LLKLLHRLFDACPQAIHSVAFPSLRESENRPPLNGESNALGRAGVSALNRGAHGASEKDARIKGETATNGRANATCLIWRRRQLLGVGGLAAKAGAPSNIFIPSVSTQGPPTSSAALLLADSALISQITFKSNTIVRMTTTKTYDFLNRLGQILSVPSAPSRMCFKRWFCGVASGTLTLICTGCTDRIEVSPVFEGLKLDVILKRVGNVPELRTTSATKLEYNFKDCELILRVPGNLTSNVVFRIMSDCTNAIVRLGGTILTNTSDSQWGSHELTYATARTKGLLRLYSAEVGNSQTKLIAVMLECRRER